MKEQHKYDGDITSDTSDSESEEVEAEFKAMHSTELSQSPSWKRQSF